MNFSQRTLNFYKKHVNGKAFYITKSAAPKGKNLVTVPKHRIECFKYLWSVIQKHREIDGDVYHKIKVWWLKWRSATEVLCVCNMPLSLKGKFFSTAVRPTLLYDMECWANKKQHIQMMSVAEMQILRWMCGKIRKDKVRNEDIHCQVGIAPIKDQLR